jgi:hypothetical protein
MLSIQGWEFWEDAHGEDFLTPAIWWTNPSRNVLRHLRLEAATGPHGEVVREALPDGDPMLIRSTAHRSPPEWSGSTSSIRACLCRLRPDGTARFVNGVH